MSRNSPVAERAVPVFADRSRRRVAGATDWWFYPLLALCAAGLIALSLGADAFAPSTRPQRATQQGGALVYGADALARGTVVDAAHVGYVVRDLGVHPRAVRFAVRPGTPPPSPADAGVRLLLDPADGAALAGRRVRAEIAVRRFSISAAAAIALRLGDGPWVQTALPPQSGVVTIDLPAAPSAPTTLGIRLLSDQTDMNYGAEFGRIVLRPLP